MSSHYTNQFLTSPFIDHIKKVYDFKSYNTKNEYEKVLIDQHLFQISLKHLKAEKDLPLIGDTYAAFTPQFSLHGHFIGGINLVISIASGERMQTPVSDGNFVIREF